METSKFNDLARARLRETEKVLLSKGVHYASEKERFTSFIEGARMKNISTVEALDGMWLKHRISIAQAIKQMNEDPFYVPSKEWVAEKLGDNINYTLLLEGLMEDRRRGVPLETNDIQRHPSEDFKSDHKAWVDRALSGEADTDKGDPGHEADLNSIIKVLDSGGSPERLRACIDLICSRRGFEGIPRTNNPA